MNKLLLTTVVLALSSGWMHSQSQSGKVFRPYQRPLRNASLDLATGTVTRGPALGQRAATTVSDFPNLDLGGFIGNDTGGGFCTWFDAGVKGTSANASDLMNNFVFAYCSSALDVNSGGLGGSTALGFYEGYVVGGGAPTTTIAILTLAGLPAASASGCGFVSCYPPACYLISVSLPTLVPFADGPIGYSWHFLDLDYTGVLAATMPFLSCVQSCSGPGPDALGMVDRMDQYCPPGFLITPPFTFGTTQFGSYFTSMSMDIREVSDCTASVASYNSTSPPNEDVLSATTAVVGTLWVAEVSHAAGTAAFATLLVRGAKIPGNGGGAGPYGRLLVSGAFLTNLPGMSDTIDPILVSQRNFGTFLPLSFGLACSDWFCQALTGGGGAIRLSNGIAGTSGTQ